ncbi:MAG: proton-conducting transporter membrane subunit [Solirubrobacterales bacterium]
MSGDRDTHSRSRAAGPILLLAAASAAAAGCVGAAVVATGDTLGADGFTDGLDPAFGVDGLSAIFLVLLALVAVPALLYARSYLRGARHASALAVLTTLFVASMALFLVARDPVTFLAAWELMTLLPAAAILLAADRADVRSAVFVYVAVTHIGGVGVWVAVLLLAANGGLSAPGLADLGAGGEAAVIAGAIVGFGTKAGLMPFHSWLPRAHPVAPAFLSALMSGAMVKVALYGLVRVLFDWVAPAPAWAGLVLLSLGALSALAGIVYALLQRDLKRLLAFSTIENVGIVAVGLAAAILLADAGEGEWAAIAFAGALLQALGHAATKGMLFLLAGTVERAAGSVDLDSLGGLLRLMPWTGGAFLVGAGAMAGLPVLVGFAAEWVAIRALVELAATAADGIAVLAAVCAAALAATAALAMLCFAKAVGLLLLGRPRRPEVESACDPAMAMRAPTAVLAALCIGAGAVPGLLLPALAGLWPLGGAPELPVTGGLDLPGTGSLPSPALLAGIVVLTAPGPLSRPCAPRAARAPVWICDRAGAGALAWSSASFTKPLQLVLAPLLRRRAGPSWSTARPGSPLP